MPLERRRLDRRNFSYYMRVTDETTKQLIGYLVDISTGGFKLDCPTVVPNEREYRLHIELTRDIADKNSMVFIARSKWCHPDHVDPNTYNVGFQIVNMTPGDSVIFQRMFEKYGSQGMRKNSSDYLWK